MLLRILNEIWKSKRKFQLFHQLFHIKWVTEVQISFAKLLNLKKTIVLELVLSEKQKEHECQLITGLKDEIFLKPFDHGIWRSLLKLYKMTIIYQLENWLMLVGNLVNNKEAIFMVNSNHFLTIKNHRPNLKVYIPSFTNGTEDCESKNFN